MDDMEKKLQGKLSREVQQMKGIFKDKGWGSETAFKKEDKFDSASGNASTEAGSGCKGRGGPLCCSVC